MVLVALSGLGVEALMATTEHNSRARDPTRDHSLTPDLVPIARMLCRAAIAIWTGEITPPWPIVAERQRPDSVAHVVRALDVKYVRARRARAGFE